MGPRGGLRSPGWGRNRGSGRQEPPIPSVLQSLQEPRDWPCITHILGMRTQRLAGLPSITQLGSGGPWAPREAARPSLEALRVHGCWGEAGVPAWPPLWLRSSMVTLSRGPGCAGALTPCGVRLSWSPELTLPLAALLK